MINRLKKAGLIVVVGCVCLIQLAPARSESSANDLHVPMGLAISGGISLGSYEAGLNWAIVKQLKVAQQQSNYRIDVYKPRITAISGASAGGINALVSAMSWCMDDDLLSAYTSDTVSNNLFRDIWLDVGFDNLLPASPGDYEETDGLLSRKAFDQVINRIRTLLKQKIYKVDCRVPVALTVTRTVPIVMDVNGIKVRNQRFVIPFELVPDVNNPGKISLRSHLVKHNDPLFGNVVYLQARPQTRDQLDIESVIQAVLATSAFPVAFGRVSLDYCIQRGIDIGAPDSRDADQRCPAGYVQESAYFVDGGVFDNVPLGLAKAMAESFSKPRNTQYNYIYLDPGSRRPYRFSAERSRDESNSFGLKSQLSFIGGAIQTGEQYELYNVLRSDDWSGSGDRRILLSSRNPPITGEFMAHFGAFIDQSFREYDYYAGIYDAMVNIAEYRCYISLNSRLMQEQCLAREAEKVFHILFDDDKNASKVATAKTLIAMLAHHEHGASDNADAWRWAWQNAQIDLPEYYSNVLIIASTLLKIDSQDQDPDLQQLVAELPANFDLSNAGFIIRRIVKYRNEDTSKWFYPLASRASVRLLELEKDEYRVTGKSLRTMAGSVALGIETLLGDQDDFVWNQSTGKNDWFKLLPYELSYDLSNIGWSMSWEPRWQVRDNWAINAKLIPMAMQRVDNDRKLFSQVDLYAAFKVSDSLISSWGVGPTYTRLRDPQLGAEQENVGYAAFIGLLGDKLRLTVGRRAEPGAFFEDEAYIYIGITDIPGISYWVNRTYQ